MIETKKQQVNIYQVKHQKKKCEVTYVKAQEANLSTRDKFKLSYFIPVIDQLCVSLSEILHSYEAIRSRFGNQPEYVDATNLYTAPEELVRV